MIPAVGLSNTSVYQKNNTNYAKNNLSFGADPLSELSIKNDSPSQKDLNRIGINAAIGAGLGLVFSLISRDVSVFGKIFRTLELTALSVGIGELLRAGVTFFKKFKKEKTESQ